MSFNIPETMHALQVVQTGPAEDALRYTQVQTPKITKPNQLLIKIKAAGVNPVEAKVRLGAVSLLNWVLKLPTILGGDYAGIVVAKGDMVKDFEVGDEVFGSQELPVMTDCGVDAEYAVVTLGKGAIAKKPTNMTFEEAAGVGIAMGTAYEGIVTKGRLDTTKKNKILVIGASGGVGTFAVQVGKAIGAEVVGICSGRNKAVVTGLGADRVVDYTQPNELDTLANEEKETFDLILDCVGGDDYYNKLSPVLKQKGVYSTATGPVEHPGSNPMGFVGIIKHVGTIAFRTCFARHPYVMITSAGWDRFNTEMLPLLANGKVKTLLRDDQIFDLKDGAKAHLQLESHRTVGKVVLRVS